MSHCFNMCEGIIVKLSDRWSSKMPIKSMYGKGDLISEGWLIYMDCLDRDVTCKFTTYLYNSVERRFLRIFLIEKRKHGSESLKQLVAVEDSNNPERLVMVNEAIEALAEVSSDFASMITDGASKEFLAFARRHMRAKKFRSNTSSLNGNILFTKELIETFFGVKIKDLRILVSNYL